MSYRNLGQFMNDLRRQGDLIEIAAPVDAHLEIAEIHRRVIAAGGPALLFTKVKGKSFPVVTNLFGTKSRVDLAFGRQPKDFVERLAALPEVLMPPTAKSLWRQRDLGWRLARIGMTRRRRAPVLRHQVPGADLTALPALTSWSEDGGPFLTLPLVHTKGPGVKPDNLGMYRIQIFDAKETGLHFQIGKGGGYHLQEAEAAGQDLPVNIYLGGPPALILSAIAPLPENVPELMLASLLLGEKLGKGRLPALANPDPIAEAEFCLVGSSPAGVRRPEGPFGDHYGYYSLTHDYPVFRPRHIFHRPGAVFPATIVGKPRQEDFFLGDYLQELLLPIIPKVMPTVTDLWSYGETGYHSLAAAVIKERYGREALTSVFRILGEGQLALTKFLLAIDKPLDLRDFRAVLTHILARVDWRQDLLVFANTAMDTLDYAGPKVNHGSKGVILGLGEAKRELPRVFTSQNSDLGPVRAVRVFSPGCFVLEVPDYPTDPGCVRQLAARPEFTQWPLLIAVDQASKAAATTAAFLWTTFTRFDPAADIHCAGSTLVHNRVSYQGPLLIDARKKPWYPGELFCDPVTAKTVGQRWTEYFPSGEVAMGDSDEGHLGVD